MSIRRIPDRLLNTTLHIVRDASTIDEVGDAETVKQLAYGSIKANVQSAYFLGRRQEVEYELNGRLYKQTHAAYFNRFQDGIKRQIIPGDYAIDLETMKHYIVLAVLDYQAANSGIDDSHHIKLILRTADQEFNLEQSAQVTSKARIAS